VNNIVDSDNHEQFYLLITILYADLQDFFKEYYNHHPPQEPYFKERQGIR